ncbi:ABC transporter permease [Paenibacillus sp. FSL H8-0457]|uniref:ABC transporter permease n=1 Tax=unclassified Paenibacillus TaxID=185978 RepID=UPI0001B9EE17|nr:MULTISPECIES: ABC transporter permease [unclassified Paenibacillus]ACX68022.1 ABC-2 type transporter [Paenibacillus sp. Y412MC10]ETT67771.1 ABC-2 type transporter [Paenibacillus sp. FSL H8-457]
MRNPITYFMDKKDLIMELTKRDLLLRYKGSYLGVVWSILNPLFMLVIYTYFFSFVLQSRWGQQGTSTLDFALILFCGISTFNFFSEIVTKSPSLILSNVNYVKKVVFPLEVLPVVSLFSAFVQLIISLVILMIGNLIINGVIYWTVVFLPLVLLPLVLLSLGIAWFLSSVGVFFRDIQHILVVVVQALMFLSPIFYPISIIPETLRPIYYINPIGYVVEDMRNILIWGSTPNWTWCLVGTLVGLIIFMLGIAWFRKTKGAFADVL